MFIMSFLCFFLDDNILIIIEIMLVYFIKEINVNK